MKTDIQIARESELKPISDIAEQLGIAPEKVEPYGRYMAKVPMSLIDEERVKKSRLILVTAISPTKVGIGKTTVSIGLSMGLIHHSHPRCHPQLW
jgi:formate--tetrahydrofolate ligase